MGFFKRKFKILFTGGGTAGSVAPLLAVAEELTSPQSFPSQGEEIVEAVGEQLSSYEGGSRARFDFLWIGTKRGVERSMVENAGIKFKAIMAGKWRRYFSFKNFLDIFKIKLAFWQALWFILNWRPSLVMSAGSFVSVPVVWAAWLLGVPVMIHQQDVRPGLANKLMAPFAKIITVTFEKSLKDYGKKAVWTGNPVRQRISHNAYRITHNAQHITNFSTQEGLPIVLVLGGGTGALAINKLVEQSLEELTKFCQVIHVTGKNKGIRNQESGIRNYVSYDFLEGGRMAEVLVLADVVVSRAGMSTLSELSYLKKPAIIIPMSDSHQEENAQMFKDAAVVLEQKDLTAEKLAREIKTLLDDEERRKGLGEQMGRVMKRGAEEEIVEVVRELCNK
jgi:UDP-N-acetylglucosamine--N-acetylmuramyl-(pentapeptide) pyrophosphoryl-undecaprenol N-acetylglucosamine transferase